MISARKSACKEQRKAQIRIPNRWTSTCVELKNLSFHNFLGPFWIQLIKHLAKNILRKKNKKPVLKWKLPLGDILLWKQHLEIPSVFWPTPSVTCAVTIFIKTATGWDIVWEKRCTCGSHGNTLMCHTFIEVKASKRLILCSLCTHRTLSLCTSIAMRNYVAWTLFKLCLQQPLSSNQQGNRRGILILITLCAWKHVIYFITGTGIPGYSNAAMPSDGGVCTHGVSEVQRLTNEPMGLQSIHLLFKYLSFSTVHCS